MTSTSTTGTPSDGDVGKELMRRLPLLEGLAEEDLERLHAMSSILDIATGTLLMREGEPGDALYIIVDGELEIVRGRGVEQQVIAVRSAGEVVGEMAVLKRAPRSASVRALRASRLLVIDHAAFATLLSCSTTATLTILDTVVARLRDSESMLMQREKLAALGTMAAGLAHELNNPAAALRRSSSLLRDALPDWERSGAELAALSPDEREQRRLTELRADLMERAAHPARLTPLARSAAEETVELWLEEREIEPAWELAPALAAAGWDRDRLESLADDFSAERVPAVVRWLAAGAGLFSLLEETRTSAEAISALVRAVKSYAYLDQAPVQEVDVHEGLEDTLTILRHKLGDGIEIRRSYADDLPTIEAFGSELNQVWTNLIDNAVQAMEGRGALELRTATRQDQIVVEIRDDGPGIPPAIRKRIFEPFFTTKPVGSGTGLGLHIAYDIVVRRHHGQLQVVSEPGATSFQVVLPVRLERPSP